MTNGASPILSSDLRPGLAVTDHVRLVSQIGEGGMGSVWLADHIALGIQVAVKFMAPALVGDASAVERFTREARAAARIHHPNIVRILDFGAPRGALPYIVMEYLQGADLATHIHRGGRLPLGLVASVVVQIAGALEKAHELGIVHRDIKPENIFLSAQPDGAPLVKIVDFGVAKQETDGPAARVTSTGATLGTPTYMSPEQMLSARSVDSKCDLWALAVVAYHAITGFLPFPGETYGAICLAVHRAKFRPPSQLRSIVPAEVDRWFSRAFTRDPSLRFQTARELGDAFVAALCDVRTDSQRREVTRRAVTPVSARAMLVTPPPSRRSVRARRWGSAAAVVALALGALLVIFGRAYLRSFIRERAAAAAPIPSMLAPAARPIERCTGVDVAFGPPAPSALPATRAGAETRRVHPLVRAAPRAPQRRGAATPEPPLESEALRAQESEPVGDETDQLQETAPLPLAPAGEDDPHEAIVPAPAGPSAAEVRPGV